MPFVHLNKNNINDTSLETYSIERTKEYINEGRRKLWPGIWLAMSACGVLAMILIGGYTRLSKSGLSMVRWKPLDYSMPQ